MSKLAAARALAAQAAETGIDMNDVQKGGGGRLLPVGWAYARLVEYVEFGVQPQEFNGVAKEPCMDFQLGFALYNTADRVYQNEDGSPYIIRPYSMALGRNEKNKSYKLWVAMNYRNLCTNFAQLVGEAYLVHVGHVPKSKTDTKLVSRISLDKVFPPLDNITGQPLPIPEARDEDIRLFLWDYPTKDAWDAMLLEGTTDDGKSKNYLQETCLAALDFEGSRLQAMLGLGGAAALPDLPSAPEVAQPNPTAPVTPVRTVAASSPAMPNAVAAVSPSAPPVGTTTSPSKVAAGPAFPAMPS